MTRQQEALLQLKQHPEYSHLKEYLETKLGKLQEGLESADEVNFRQLQGGCQAVRALLDMFETELTLIDKLTNGTKPTQPERVVG